MAKSPTVPCHQLKVTLLGVKPPVWRRITVPSDVDLGSAALAVLFAMGWENSHLHEWRKGDERYGMALEDEPFDDETKDEVKATLDEVLPRVRGKILFAYDFGDSWEHEVVFEKRVEGPPKAVVLDGASACPPEDSGGPWGYADGLEALADEEHPDHEDMVDWFPKGFDPKDFEVAEANERLSKLRWKRGPGTWQRR